MAASLLFATSAAVTLPNPAPPPVPVPPVTPGIKPSKPSPGLFGNSVPSGLVINPLIVLQSV